MQSCIQDWNFQRQLWIKYNELSDEVKRQTKVIVEKVIKKTILCYIEK